MNKNQNPDKARVLHFCQPVKYSQCRHIGPPLWRQKGDGLADYQSFYQGHSGENVVGDNDRFLTTEEKDDVV
mgnify:CR=1 FL=1